MASKSAISERKNAIFDPKRAILTPHYQNKPDITVSNSNWPFGTKKYHFTLKIMILAI